MSPGPSDTDYASASASASAIAARQAAAQTGPYRNGAAANFADFDQSYVPINPASDAQTGSSYTVRDGDSLQSIAASLWGDGSLWYLIADANGLTGTTALAGGMALAIPNKVTNLHNDSTTFRVYDPNKAVGDVQPDDPLEATPQPAPAAGKKKHGCGAVGKILAVVVAVVVTVATAGALAGLTIPQVLAGGLASLSLPAAIGVGALAGAAGSVASQVFSLAIGDQDKFSWKGVALGAIAGGISGGLAKFIPGSTFTAGAERGAISSVLTQGVGMATGLQSKFDWAGVAVSGVVGGVSAAAGNWAAKTGLSGLGVGAVSGSAGLLAGAATRSMLTGTDFGDNILADLPSVIGATLGNAIAGQFAGSSSIAADFAHDLGILGQGIKKVGNAVVGGIKTAASDVAHFIEAAFSSRTPSALAIAGGDQAPINWGTQRNTFGSYLAGDTDYFGEPLAPSDGTLDLASFKIGDLTFVTEKDKGDDAHLRLEMLANSLRGPWFANTSIDPDGTRFYQNGWKLSIGRPDLGNANLHQLWELKPRGQEMRALDQVWDYSISTAPLFGAPVYRPAPAAPSFFAGNKLSLPGAFGTINYNYWSSGVITWSYKLEPKYISVPSFVPVPLPAPGEVMRALPRMAPVPVI